MIVTLRQFNINICIHVPWIDINSLDLSKFFVWLIFKYHIDIYHAHLLQELNEYLSVNTSTSVIIDKSSDGEFLRIDFNLR